MSEEIYYIDNKCSNKIKWINVLEECKHPFTARDKHCLYYFMSVPNALIFLDRNEGHSYFYLEKY